MDKKSTIFIFMEGEEGAKRRLVRPFSIGDKIKEREREGGDRRD